MNEAGWRDQVTQIVEALASGVLVINAGGRIVFANPEAARIMGQTPSVLVGKRYDDPRWRMVPLDDGRPPREGAFAEAWTGKAAYCYEYAIERPDGTKAIVSLNSGPLGYADGEVATVVVSFTDISELKQVQEQNETILRTSMDGFILLDMRGRFLDINDAFCGIIGYSREELLTMGVIDIEFKETDREVMAHAQKVKRLGTDRFETRLRRKDGVLFDAESSAHYLPLRKGLIFSFVRDVTERKQAEEQYKSILQASMDGFVLSDVNGRFLDVNEAFCRQTGYSRAEALRLSARDIVVGADPEERIKRVVETGSDRWEDKIKRKDDVVIDLEMSANYLDVDSGRLVFFGREITERKRLENALRQEKVRAEKYLEVAGVMLVAIDADQKVTLINRKGCQVLGYPREEIIGKNWFDNFLPSEVSDKVKAVFSGLISGEIESSEYFENFENPVLTKGGETRHIAWQNTFLSDEYGRTVGTLSSGEDITERKQAEEALRAGEDRYHRLFDGAPVSLWEEDFSDIKALCDDLRRRGVGDFRAYFASHTEDVVRCAKMVKIVDVNEATLELYQAKSREDFRKGLPRLFTKESYRFFREELIALAEGKTRVEGETINRTLDGRRIDVALRLFLAPGYEQTWSKVLLSVVDMTEHKRQKGLSDALSDVSAVIGSTLDFDQIMKRVAREACRAIGAETTRIIMREPGGWVVGHVYGFSPESVGTRLTAKEASLFELAAAGGKSIVIGDTEADPRIERETVEKHGFRSLLLAPLIARGEVIGAITFNFHSRAVVFSDAQIDFANRLRVLVSLAIENVESYQASQRALADAETLGRIAARINETLEIDQLLDTALFEALAALGAGNGCIYVFDETGKLVIRTQRQLSKAFLKTKGVLAPGDGCAGTAAVSKKMFAPSPKQENFVCKESKKLLGLDCLAAIPIVARGESLGVLELFAPVARRLTKRERGMAEAIANQLATALQNARLFAAQRDIADTLQKALLTIPEKIEGLDLGHLYRSATVTTGEVGGDFYDVFELEHDRIGIILGDVSGKGLGAATFTSLIKDTIKAYCSEESVPALVMTKTNEAISKMQTAPMFATVFFGILDKASGVLSYCNAGHPPAILKRKTEILELTTKSPVIGIFREMEFTGRRVVMEKGDVLILYTDGVTEARRDGQFFGEERLARFIKGLGDRAPREVPELIFDAVALFSHGSLADDVALLAISRR